MGQKVNPVGMRIGVNREWNSRWYADDKDYNVYLNQDIKIRNFINKFFKDKDAQISHVEIERIKNDKDCKITIIIFSARPAVAIGEAGKTVNQLKDNVMKLLPSDVSVDINVVTVDKPFLDANIVAQSIAKQLEARASFRVAQKEAIKNTRKAGAKGIRTLVSGRLGGADIARSEGYKEGTIPLHTLRSDVDYACAEAATQYGRLGVKVWICRGEIRPELDKKVEKEGE